MAAEIYGFNGNGVQRERIGGEGVLAEHDTQRQNELSCYQHSQNPVEEMLRKNVGFKGAPPYKRLERDLRRFLQRVDAETAPREAVAAGRVTGERHGAGAPAVN